MMRNVTIIGLALLGLTLAGCGLFGGASDTPTTPLSGGDGYGGEIEGGACGNCVAMVGSWTDGYGTTLNVYSNCTGNIDDPDEGYNEYTYSCDETTVTVYPDGADPIVSSWSITNGILTVCDQPDECKEFYPIGSGNCNACAALLGYWHNDLTYELLFFDANCTGYTNYFGGGHLPQENVEYTYSCTGTNLVVTGDDVTNVMTWSITGGILTLCDEPEDCNTFEPGEGR